MSRAPVVGKPETSETIIASYVDELATLLRGPARARTDVLEEIASGLEDSVRRRTSGGLTVLDAEQAAISELGSAEAVAQAFDGELAVAHSRRVSWILVLTGPLVGIWWLLLLTPTDWQGRPGVLINAIPVLPMVAAAVAAIVVLLATTGSLIRWFPESTPLSAVTVTAIVGLFCVVGDIAVLTILVTRWEAGSIAAVAFPLAATAATASLTRLPFAVWATTSSLRTRRRLRRPTPVERGGP